MAAAIPFGLATPLRPLVAFLGVVTRFAGRRGGMAVGLVGAAAVLDGSGLLLLVPILDTVMDPHSKTRIGSWLDGIGLHQPMERLIPLLVLFLLLTGVRTWVQAARDLALARLQAGFVEHQRMRVLRTVADASWSSSISVRHAEALSLLTTEVSRVASCAQFLIQSAVAAALLAVQATLAVVLAPLLALPVLALGVAGGMAMIASQHWIARLGRQTVSRNSAVMGSAAAFLGSLKAAAAHNAQAAFLTEFGTIQGQLRDATVAFQRRQVTSRSVFAIGSAAAGGGVALAGVANGTAPALLIALILIFARMSGPAALLAQGLQSLAFNLPSFAAIQRFQASLGGDEHPTPIPLQPPQGALRAQDIGYVHPGGGGIHAASLTIPPGTFVGITGPSGAGKTTLVDLLIGLTVPQRGTLAVGGRVLDAAGRAGWRETVGYVPQDGFLFHDSLRRNLLWGNTATDDAGLWDALALAGADMLVRRLPDGLDTLVGERGALLSGGERQRIALARALLRQPRLLVLDEASNAIDAASESALLERVAALSPRPTVLMISHRVESLAVCDRILRVEAGVVSG